MKSPQVHRVFVDETFDKLERELERLKRKLKAGYELTLKWLPNENCIVSGEVRGTCIHIYELDEEKARETLKHEFLDYLISKAIEPYKKVANQLINYINEEIYERKEQLIEVLTKLL